MKYQTYTATELVDIANKVNQEYLKTQQEYEDEFETVFSCLYQQALNGKYDVKISLGELIDGVGFPAYFVLRDKELNNFFTRVFIDSGFQVFLIDGDVKISWR